MAKITLDVPEDIAEELRSLERRLRELEADKDGAESAIGEDEIDSAVAGISRSLKRRSLQALDIDAQRILIEGKGYVAVGRYESRYFTREGPVGVTRTLFREEGVRNGPTVDTVSVRAGCVDGWLPRAAEAAAFLLQQGTSREAEATGKALGVLPYSRSSFERIGHSVGKRFWAVRDAVESKLIEDFRVPAKARSISVSVDRVAVPFEEPKARPPGRPRRGAAKRPVTRAWRMAFVGTVTLHDRHGEALHTIRYGRVPGYGAEDLVGGMLADVKVLLHHRRRLKIALLTDGGKDMVDVLDRHFTRAALGGRLIHRIVDFWHVMEKLAGAARLIHGSDADRVVTRWKLLLLNSASAVNRIRDELLESGLELVADGDGCPVHAAITYLKNQGPRMDYPAARARGLPIGSGNVEATCKSLIRQRLVRSGARWKPCTAQHVIDLRALALSSRWEPALKLTLGYEIKRVSRAA